MINKNIENKIIALIKETGPLTGAEIRDSMEDDGLSLWRACRLSNRLNVRNTGIRYLRLDRRVEGYARLSPSILREFLTYSVIGLAGDHSSMSMKSDAISSHIEQISRTKSEQAYRIISSLTNQFENELPIKDRLCFILAGDIVFNMAHDVPRPERSTGKIVKGSDIDLVVIVDDLFPEKSLKRLDDAIFQEKYRLLITPHIREEIDYIIKRLVRVREQVRFESFGHMVACKILHEGTLLYGSHEIFHTAKSMLRENGIIQKLDALEKKAVIFRKKAEESLLCEDTNNIKLESSYLFYPIEESEEFE